MSTDAEKQRLRLLMRRHEIGARKAREALFAILAAERRQVAGDTINTVRD